MRSGFAMAGGLLLLLCGCGPSPVEGAWEARIDLPQGSDPSGYEVHLALTRFLVGEPSGAVEYTVFHPTQEMETCKGKLEGVAKEAGGYQYEETITRGKCDTGATIQVAPAGTGSLQFQRIDVDGNAVISGTLETQTGVRTAKDRAGG